MNVSYPMANNLPDLDSLIDEKVNRILNQITEVSNQAKINVQFLSKSSNKKKTGWFGNSTYNAQDDLVVWESWLINVESLPLDQVSNGELLSQRKSHITIVTTTQAKKAGELI